MKIYRVAVVAQNILVGFWMAMLLSNMSFSRNAQRFVLVSSAVDVFILRFLLSLKKVSNITLINLKNVEANCQISKESRERTIDHKKNMRTKQYLDEVMSKLLCIANNYDVYIVFNHLAWPCVTLQDANVPIDSIEILENANFQRAWGKFTGSARLARIATLRHDSFVYSNVSPWDRILVSTLNKVFCLSRHRMSYILNYIFCRLLFQIAVIVWRALKLRQKELFYDCHVLVMQIANDSAIRDKLTVHEYLRLFIDYLAFNNIRRVCIRPHPKDYTLGWLRLYTLLRKKDIKVVLSFDKIMGDSVYFTDNVITYSSNLVKYLSKRTNVIFLGGAPQMMDIKNRPGDIFFRGIYSS